MTKKEMYETVMRIKEENEFDYYHMGIRFEDKERNAGDIIAEVSRHNSDREDEREFPEYGTDGYEELEELDGISAWSIEEKEHYTPAPGKENEPAEKGYLTKHAYIIASDDAGSGDDLDHGEILLKDAVVLAKIF